MADMRTALTSVKAAIEAIPTISTNSIKVNVRELLQLADYFDKIEEGLQEPGLVIGVWVESAEAMDPIDEQVPQEVEVVVNLSENPLINWETGGASLYSLDVINEIQRTLVGTQFEPGSGRIMLGEPALLVTVGPELESYELTTTLIVPTIDTR